MIPSASPRGILRSTGNKLTVFREASHKCVVIPPDSKIERKRLRKNEFLEEYEGFASSKSGNQTELYYRNDTMIVPFLAAYKNKDIT